MACPWTRSPRSSTRPTRPRLREAVADAARSTTVLVGAHHPPTVTAAGRIVVTEEGRAGAVGPHAELPAADALYRDLAATRLPGPLPGEPRRNGTGRAGTRNHRDRDPH